MQKFLIFSFIFLFVACKETAEEQIPDYVIPAEKMANVLVDVHLVEATLNVGMGANPMNPSFSGQPNAGHITEDVFKKHGISKQLYDTSFTFYSQHPQMLNEIYQTVLNELSKKQAEVLSQ